MALLLLLALGAFLVCGRYSLPQRDGGMAVPGLSAAVKVRFDPWAVPTIEAHSREDAYRALGFVTASDRFFQMELMRRKSAGRLAEIFGEKAVDLDRWQRTLGLEAVARRVVADLPPEQRRVLDAYAEGVNAYLETQSILPPEFWALRHRPEPWRGVDSILVALGMFQTLNWIAEDERMLTVMENCLPPEVTAFLTPDTDAFPVSLVGGDEGFRAIPPLPANELSKLRGGSRDALPVLLRTPPPGSNAWAVAGIKTLDGRAILANDMHLGLGVPNVWYRAALRYRGGRLIGLTLPGVPLVVAGSNGRVTWGFSNALTDSRDLILLEIDPGDRERYRTPGGWRRFQVSRERISVKNGKDMVLHLARTIWGPLLAEPLLGQPVALKWAALEPGAVNLSLLDMDSVTGVDEAALLMNRAGIPALNVVLADREGRIAWTIAGRIPRRRGFDGAVARSWAHGPVGWDGFLPPDALPRLMDPPAGFLVAANQRTTGRGFPLQLGHNYEYGYRAHRIAERLASMSSVGEKEMLALQLDTRTEFYDFYRILALSVIAEPPGAKTDLEDSLRAWNGRADPESLGLPLLVEFRGILSERIFSSYLSACRDFDPGFRYRWLNMETPLRALLRAQDPDTLPQPERFADWRAFIRGALLEAASRLQRQSSDGNLSALTWGRYNRYAIQHPFSRVVPALSDWLDMPSAAAAGCVYCIRVSKPRYGVSERLVVAPGFPEEGMLHMPGGQSGNPFSPHYADQFSYWHQGRPLPFNSAPALTSLSLVPLRGAASGSASRNASTD